MGIESFIQVRSKCFRGDPRRVRAVRRTRRGRALPHRLWFRFDVVNDEAEATEQEQQQPGATARVALPGEFRFALAQPRALRYLVLKLISSEDRMVAMQDDHASPNIDLEYCGLDGWRCAEPPQATSQSQGGMYDVD